MDWRCVIQSMTLYLKLWYENKAGIEIITLSEQETVMDNNFVSNWDIKNIFNMYIPE